MKKFIAFALCVAMSAPLFAQEINIIPQPQSVEVAQGSFELTQKSTIVYSGALESEALYLQDLIEASTGFDIELSQRSKRKGYIELAVDSVKVSAKEGYELQVGERGVNIYGHDAAGVFYGIQTLLQLLPEQIYSKYVVRDVQWSAPCVTVQDAPHLPWRAMMFDSARYFYSIDYIKRYIDLMAMYKLNKFQFHFIDDSGWRLELDSYPRLTEVGAWSGEGVDRIGGYYTKAEMRDLIEYAAVRKVEIIPEIAFPAHMLSAVVAYPWLSCRGLQHEVPSQHSISRELLCVGNPKAIKFLEDVITEASELFPSQYFGIGGDEAVYTHWETCPKCQAVVERENLENTPALQGYLTEIVAEKLASLGKTPLGWQEIAERKKLNNKVVALIWKDLNDTWPIIEDGHQVVLTPATHTYFDFPESGKKGEPQAAVWMPPISVEQCYSLDVEGYNRSNAVLGVEGCYWSDQFIHGTSLREIDLLDENRSERYVEYLSFPRMMALSEVAWSVKERRGFEDFRGRMANHFLKLDNLECMYRVPEPVVSDLAETDSGVTFTLAESVDNSQIRYTTDGSYPHRNSPLYDGPVTVAKRSDFMAITLTSTNHVSLPLHLDEQYGQYAEYGTFVDEWGPEDIGNKEFKKWRFEASGKITSNGKYEITFLFTGGSTQTHINHLSIYKRDELLVDTNQASVMGGNNQNNKYVVDITAFEAGTPFYIDVMCKGRQSADSHGVVFIKKVE